MSFFLYHRRTAITGRLLAQALRLPAGDRPDRVILPNEWLIRWGSQVSCSVEQQLNSLSGIANATDKLHALEILHNAGVPTPRWRLTAAQAAQELNFPILGRSRDHTRGRDIEVFQRSIGLNTTGHTRDFFVEFVPKVREFRIHVFCGQPILSQIKVVNNERLAARRPVIWNHRNGYIYRNMRSSLPSLDRRSCAIMAVQALGLDFGAVDLIVGPDDSTYVLEVNTGPGLAYTSAVAYAEAMAGVLGIPLDQINRDALRPLGSEE